MTTKSTENRPTPSNVVILDVGSPTAKVMQDFAKSVGIGSVNCAEGTSLNPFELTDGTLVFPPSGEGKSLDNQLGNYGHLFTKGTDASNTAVK